MRRPGIEWARRLDNLCKGGSTLDSGTDFHVVANRLCRIRGGDELVDEASLIGEDGFLEPSRLLLSSSDPPIPGGLIAPEDLPVSALVLLGEPGIGKSMAFERLLATSQPAGLVRVDGASLTDANFYDLIGRRLEAVVAVENSERDNGQPALTVVIDQLAGPVRARCAGGGRTGPARWARFGRPARRTTRGRRPG